MQQIKSLKKWGSGLGIYFDKEEVKNLGMIENDKVDISDMFLIDEVALSKNKRGKNGKK